jgi:hypothetical protein
MITAVRTQLMAMESLIKETLGKSISVNYSIYTSTGARGNVVG